MPTENQTYRDEFAGERIFLLSKRGEAEQQQQQDAALNVAKLFIHRA